VSNILIVSTGLDGLQALHDTLGETTKLQRRCIASISGLPSERLKRSSARLDVEPMRYVHGACPESKGLLLRGETVRPSIHRNLNLLQSQQSMPAAHRAMMV
jgi:hypothetical protein